MADVWRRRGLPRAVVWQLATHTGQITLLEPVRQPNLVFANWSAIKRPLATLPNRSTAACQTRAQPRGRKNSDSPAASASDDRVDLVGISASLSVFTYGLELIMRSPTLGRFREELG